MQSKEQRRNDKRIYDKEYWQKNKERLQQHRQKNKEKISTVNKKYREENKEKIQLWNKKWRLKNRVRIRQRYQEWKLKNTDKIKTRRQEYRKTHKEEEAEYTRQKKYGLSKGKFSEMLSERKNCCDICGEKMTQPQVDHDHNTHKIRGLLCKSCNWALGNVHDSVEILESAIKYLKKTGGENNGN